MAALPISDGGADVSPLDASAFADRIAALKPAAYAPDRAGALQAASRFLSSNPKAEILWIADGLELGGASDFADKLKSLAGDRSLTVATDARTPVAINGLDEFERRAGREFYARRRAGGKGRGRESL